MSFWPGEGDATDVVGPNSGTVVGSGFEPGVVGLAFSFDAGTPLVFAPTTGLPVGSADRTIELWARPDQAITSEAFFAGYGDFGTNSATYHLGTSGWTLFFSQWGLEIFGPQLTPGQWVHVAATSSGGVTRLYLDGNLVGTSTLPLATPTNSTMYFGRIPPVLGDTRRLLGAVDEISVYDRALSASELQAIVAAGPGGKCH